MIMEDVAIPLATVEPDLDLFYTDSILWSDATQFNFTTDALTTAATTTTARLGTAEQILQGAFFCLVIALTTLGNCLVVLAVCLEKKLRTFENFFFASLAVADLSIAMLVLPLSVRVELSGGQWDLGPRVCDLFIFTDVACCTASILHLCTIGINRCRSITSPLHYVRKQTFRRAAGMILVVWVTSFLIACPPLLGWPQTRNRGEHQCEYDVDKLYVIYSSCGSFFIPLVVMVIVYSRIYVVSRRGAMFRRNSAPQLNDNYYHQSCNHQQQHAQSCRNNSQDFAMGRGLASKRRLCDSVYRAEQSGARRTGRRGQVSEVAYGDYGNAEEVHHVRKPVLRRIFTFHPPRRCDGKRKFTEVKTVKTLGIIMGAFVVCWLPFFLLYVIKPFCTDCSIPMALDRFALWLGYLNSLLNPIIYICCKPLFRLTFKRILCLSYCRKQGEWTAGVPVQRGILVNSSHQKRPNSSSDGPSLTRRKKPGRVMFADCPPRELNANNAPNGRGCNHQMQQRGRGRQRHNRESSFSRTPTLPPARDSTGAVTYRSMPPRETSNRQSSGSSSNHTCRNPVKIIAAENGGTSANSSCTSWFGRFGHHHQNHTKDNKPRQKDRKAQQTTAAQIHHSDTNGDKPVSNGGHARVRRVSGTSNSSSTSSANNVNTSKLCCSVTKIRSSEIPDPARSSKGERQLNSQCDSDGYITMKIDIHPNPYHQADRTICSNGYSNTNNNMKQSIIISKYIDDIGDESSVLLGEVKCGDHEENDVVKVAPADELCSEASRDANDELLPYREVLV